MEGLILNYRRSRHVQRNKHMIIRVPSIDTKEKASKLINKKVMWKSPTGKELIGVIKSTHGNTGAVRVIFDKGSPKLNLTEHIFAEPDKLREQYDKPDFEIFKRYCYDRDMLEVNKFLK